MSSKMRFSDVVKDQTFRYLSKTFRKTDTSHAFCHETQTEWVFNQGDMVQADLTPGEPLHFAPHGVNLNKTESKKLSKREQELEDLARDLADIQDRQYKEAIQTYKKSSDGLLSQNIFFVYTELNEIERTVEYLNNNGFDTDIEFVLEQFLSVECVSLSNDIWSLLENTDSYTISFGDIEKAESIGILNNKETDVIKFRMEEDAYYPPLIVKYWDKYHLVGGNTRLCFAAAMGIVPDVMIADLNPMTYYEVPEEYVSYEIVENCVDYSISWNGDLDRFGDLGLPDSDWELYRENTWERS